MTDEPEDPEAADEPDADETEAEAQLRAQLQNDAAKFKALTDGLKVPPGLAKQLKAFEAIDLGPLGEQFKKLEADRESVIESLIGPASRIQADIEALTASFERPA